MNCRDFFMGKIYIDIDEKSLNKFIRKQAEDYFKGEIRKDFNDIVKSVVEEKLKGKDMLEMVKEAVKLVLPIEKITRKGLEANAIKKDWITGIINEEISKKIKEAMPKITVDVTDWEKIFVDE